MKVARFIGNALAVSELVSFTDKDSRDATEWRRSRFCYAEFARLTEMDSRAATERRRSRLR